MLKEDIAQRADPQTDNRNLCLLVVYNSPLIMAWAETMNNGKFTAPQFADRRFWKDGKGLTVWDVTTQGPPNGKNGRLPYDVVMCTSQLLQNNDSWVTKFKWHTVIADEAHEYLRGQHNKKVGPGEVASLTLKSWYKLQTCTRSMFLITGTPFVTNIRYDFVAITKAVAREDVRNRWGPLYSDDGLQQLIKGHLNNITHRNEVEMAAHTEASNRMATAFSGFCLRRDSSSRIRNLPVIEDYIAQCRRYEEPLVPTDGGVERARREELYRKHWGNRSNGTTRVTM